MNDKNLNIAQKLKTTIGCKQALLCLFLFIFSSMHCYKIQAQEDQKQCCTLLDRNASINNSSWLKTCNGTGICMDSIPEINTFSLLSGFSKQPFGKINTAKQLSFYGLNTSGYKYLNHIALEGNFNYKHAIEKDINWYLRYNSDEQNPFYIADSIGGDWTKDEAYTQFSISTLKPVWKITPSAKVTYNIGYGGRDNDPRPECISYNLTAYPSISFKSKNSFFVGLTGIIGSSKEDIDVETVNGVGGSAIYKINGFMIYGQPITKGSLTYRFQGNSKGIAIQLGKSKSQSQLITEVKYVNTYEKAIQSPYAASLIDGELQMQSSYIEDAAYNRQSCEVLISKTWMNCNNKQHLEFTGDYSKGLSYLYESEQVEYEVNHYAGKLSYQYFKRKSEHYNRGFMVDVAYQSNKQENYFYAKQTLGDLMANAGLQLIFGEPEESRIEVDLQAGYKTNLKSEFTIDPESEFIDETNTITEPVVYYNFNHLMANYFQQEASATWYFQTKNQMNFYLQLSEQLLVPDKYDTNYQLMAHLGIIF